jgi:hypothetical protein
MENAPKDLINEILGLSNANLLLREQISRLELEIKSLRQMVSNTTQTPSDECNTTAPMEKL